MVASLAARGPDDEGLVRRDWFALGIRRLAIVAVDAGRQPVSTPSGDVTLAFNGEIYDYEEIARALRRRHSSPSTCLVGSISLAA